MHGKYRRRQVAFRALAVLGALALGGCQVTPVATDSGQVESRAASLAAEGRHQDAARIYVALAGEAQGDERTRLTLLAVDEWVRAGDAGRARTAFATTTTPRDDELRIRWTLTDARLQLATGDARGALETLGSLDTRELSVEQRLDVDALTGAALFGVGKPRQALGLLVRREMWLDDSRSVRANHEIIWSGLRSSRVSNLEQALEVTTDMTIRGWLALGISAATNAEDSLAFRADVADWRRSYPGHPALADLVPSLLGTDIRMVTYPQQIGVLLPLSGRSATAGAAIRDGLLGAYYNDLVSGTRPLLRFYDVATEGNVYAYRKAVEEGAEFIIGPLLKSSVVDIATGVEIAVPTLALNTLPDEVVAPAGLYQFALSPEDEAAQVGERAVLDERPRGVALIPRSDWGDRVLNAFANSLVGSGGRLLDYRLYEAGGADFSGPIEDLLLLNESVERYRRMRRLVGEPLQFEPRRRGDIDFIFLAAEGQTARLLRPQLKFHYAGDIPVYATSAINRRDGRSDADLNGVLFPEIPWIVSERTDTEMLRELFTTLWPGSESYSRLHAMGYDAYRLVGELQRPEGAFAAAVAGMTGELSMDAAGRIHRRLPFATFRRGELEPVPEPEPEIEEFEILPGNEILLRRRDSGADSRAWAERDASG